MAKPSLEDAAETFNPLRRASCVSLSHKWVLQQPVYFRIRL